MQLPWRSSATLLLLLVLGACGGGGGSNPVPQVSPSPQPSPTTGPIGVGLTVGVASGATGSFIAGAANVTVTVPGSLIGSGAVNAVGSTSLPLNSPAITTGLSTQICVAIAAPNTSMQFATSPAFSITLPASVSTAGEKFFLAYWTPARPIGWTQPYGPQATVNGQTLTFAGASYFNLTQGLAGNFCVYEQPSGSPTSTPAPPGTSTLLLSVSGLTSSMHSAAVTINGGTVPTVSIPVGCASPCVLTLSVPAGVNSVVKILTYATSDGTGTPLALGSTTGSILSSGQTLLSVSIAQVMASFKVSLTPSTVTTAVQQQIFTCVTPYDASGTQITSSNYVDLSGATPAFTTSLTDATGQTYIIGNPAPSCGSIQYTGIESGPTSVTMNEGALSASATLTFLPANNAVPSFVTIDNSGVYYEFSANQTAPFHQFLLNQTGQLAQAAFDASGNLWMENNNSLFGTFLGVRSDGSFIGAINNTDHLLTIDSKGNFYTTDYWWQASPETGLREYSVSGLTSTLVRYVTPPSGTILAAAVDPTGNAFVVTPLNIYEFAPGPSGAIMPTAQVTETSLAPTLTIDAAGDVFASTGSSILKWPVGTFGVRPPQTIPLPTAPLNSGTIQYIAALHDGSGCASVVALGQYSRTEVGIFPWASPTGSTPVCPTSTATYGLIGPIP